MKKRKIIIATRGSKLALWQAEWVKAQLEKNRGIEVELKKIKTTGDKILDVPLAQVGGKGLFVKEIEDALLKKKADLAVHSMKDVPTDLPGGLHLSAICKREDPRDALITGIQNSKFKIQNFKSLPTGAHIGTSSLRRICQLLNKRPDLTITQLRGNLDTRLRKLDEGQFDAIILAAAGVKRLGLKKRITEILQPETSLPAIGQGAIGIECRVDDEFINGLLKKLDHRATSVCVRAERAFLKKLEGGCQVPIGAYARIEKKGQGSRVKGQGKGSIPETLNSILLIKGLVGSLDGKTLIKSSKRGKPEDAETLGTKLAEALLAKGAGKILKEVYGKGHATFARIQP
ncbi:MAG: hydroxymethylbilane synthase [Nitrospiraceae bacterium]|nr:MAG: hydroxymethylbilane synthase [Nitrospiraceae bacterium]